MSGNTQQQKTNRVENEKRSNNYYIIMISTLVSMTLGLLYIIEAVDWVKTIVGYAGAVSWNGLASVFGWEPTTVDIVKSGTGLIVFMVFTLANCITLYTNKQNR